MKRSRMIMDLPEDVQMAIRLRAIKLDVTTGEVVALAMQNIYPKDVIEANKILKERDKRKGL